MIAVISVLAIEMKFHTFIRQNINLATGALLFRSRTIFLHKVLLNWIYSVVHNFFQQKTLYALIFPFYPLCQRVLIVQHRSNTVNWDNWLYPLYLLHWCWTQGLTELFLKTICLNWFHLFLAVKICGSYTFTHCNSLSPSLLLQFKAINPARGG